jgi:hypothetical protein
MHLGRHHFDFPVVPVSTACIPVTRFHYRNPDSLESECVVVSAIQVNVQNFVRAETDTMFAAILTQTGGIGVWSHSREPTPLDQQTIIRMNQDTLYSSAIVDISQGATLSMPDAGDRYMSVMVVNQDHYINRVFHDPGVYHLTVEEFDTPYVCLAARILVDPRDPSDVQQINELQDQLTVSSESSQPFQPPAYDQDSYRATRNAVLELARYSSGFGRAFGRKNAVDPIQHLLATAAGWGGLPREEAFYQSFEPDVPAGEYKIEIGDVPVDAFWSISLYNREGYFEPNSRNLNSVNSVTATQNADGTTTVHFGNSEEDKPNYLPIMEGWNYLVRLYRPLPEILDGRWTFPELQQVR